MTKVTVKKRARVGGKFKADDPSTTGINEAWEDSTVANEKKAPAQKAPAPKKAKAETPPPWSALYKAMVLRGEIKE